MKTLAVSLSVGTQPLETQIHKIIDAIDFRLELNPLVVLATHSVLDPKGHSAALDAVAKFPGQVLCAAADTGTFSAAYLLGMQVAARSGADYIVSMDSDGAHTVCDMATFVGQFEKGYKVVLASRHVIGGKNKYPFQRKIVSLAGTVMSNLVLAPRGHLITDFTSGYEGLSVDVVNELFDRFPIETWISVKHGPYHLQNTELRAKLMQLGYKIREVPITYGEGKKGRNLSVSYLVEAFRGFVLLAQDTRNARRKG